MEAPTAKSKTKRGGLADEAFLDRYEAIIKSAVAEYGMDVIQAIIGETDHLPVESEMMEGFDLSA